MQVCMLMKMFANCLEAMSVSMKNVAVKETNDQKTFAQV